MTSFDICVLTPSRALRRRRAQSIYRSQRDLRFAKLVASKISTLKARNQG